MHLTTTFFWFNLFQRLSMEFSQFLVLGASLLSKIRLPSGKPPPEPDVVEIYKRCRAEVDTSIGVGADTTSVPDIALTALTPPPVGHDGSSSLPSASALAGPAEPSSVATACVPCLRAHMSTVSGALSEAERMSRGGSIADPEVADRIRLAQDEITMAERKDLAPEAILRAPKSEQAIIEEFLPQIRQLRQHITTIYSRDDLVKVAGEANEMGSQLTLRHLQSKGVDVQQVVDIAKQVSDGTITAAEAENRVKELVKAR